MKVLNDILSSLFNIMWSTHLRLVTGAIAGDYGPEVLLRELQAPCQVSFSARLAGLGIGRQYRLPTNGSMTKVVKWLLAIENSSNLGTIANIHIHSA